MIKNNKGVTLIELLIVIVVMGIIAAFAIPAVGTIIDNTNKDAVIADALAVENAANLYCASTQCDSDVALTWAQVGPFVSGLDIAEYTIATNIVQRNAATDGWTVNLPKNTAKYSYYGIPSEDTTRAGIDATVPTVVGFTW
ncbi:MAG: prepilin-type N-terminal cleavage/methylation domain-containing protein [Firmicutes bacterium]|nr:prepilin-type N-terminal cleavage/methylation domain-containing protein [Bacillota bacterium]